MANPIPKDSIDDFVESELTMDGVNISLNPKSRNITFSDGSQKKLSKALARDLELFLKEGYATRDEFKKLHPYSSDLSISSQISRLRKTIGKDKQGQDIIKNRSNSNLGYVGGYFIGDLSQHRNGPENLVEKLGMTLNKLTGCLKIPDKDDPVYLTPLQTAYSELLFNEGYATRDEFMKFHPDCFDVSVDGQIKRLRKIMGKDEQGQHIIKNRSSGGSYEGGYFIGDLSQYRNSPENLVEKLGMTLNKVTGCLRIPDRDDPVYLTALPTEVMELFMNPYERPVNEKFIESNVSSYGKSNIRGSITKINNKIIPYAKIVSGGYGTCSFKLTVSNH